MLTNRDLAEARASLRAYQQWKREQRAAGVTDKIKLCTYSYEEDRRRAKAAEEHDPR